MDKLKLGNDDVKKSLNHLIHEARICSETENTYLDQEKGVLGFAAMLTIFPVMLSVSEAILGQEDNNENLFRTFLSKMENPSNWLIQPQSYQESDAAKTLAGIRNGLAHQVSLPPQLLLAGNNREAQKWKDEEPYQNFVIICVADFIAEVKMAISRILDDPQYSDKVLDPSHNIPRKPVIITGYPGDDNTITAGSTSGN